MPDTNEQHEESTEQESTEVEETKGTTDAGEDHGEDDSGERDDGEEKAQEAKPKPPAEFDAKRAQDKIRKANNEAANLRKRIKELEPLAKKARDAEEANKTETERLQGQLDAAEKRIESLRARAVKSEIRAKAAATFADATDPEAHLTLSDYVTDDGDIDTAQIESDLAELLERKPHLGKAKPEPERKRPAPDRTQASGANKQKTQDPADIFAGFVKSRMK